MMKKVIDYPGNFPLSKAILHDSKYSLEISGFIGINFETGKLAEGIEEQTKQTIENIKKTLQEVGWDLSNVIKTRVYLSNMEDYEKMNEVYSKHFQEPFPTRVVVGIKELPAGALVEIESVAAGDEISEKK